MHIRCVPSLREKYYASYRYEYNLHQMITEQDRSLRTSTLPPGASAAEAQIFSKRQLEGAAK